MAGSEPYREKCLQEKGEQCAICTSSENVHVHHLDGDRSNNSIENLIPLCGKHHKQVHNRSVGLDFFQDKLEQSKSDLSVFEGADMQVTTIRLPGWVIAQYDEVAEEVDQDRSSLIRNVLIRALAER